MLILASFFQFVELCILWDVCRILLLIQSILNQNAEKTPEMADTTSLGNSPQKYMIFALGPSHFYFWKKEKEDLC